MNRNWRVYFLTATNVRLETTAACVFLSSVVCQDICLSRKIAETVTLFKRRNLAVSYFQQQINNPRPDFHCELRRRKRLWDDEWRFFLKTEWKSFPKRKLCAGWERRGELPGCTPREERQSSPRARQSRSPLPPLPAPPPSQTWNHRKPAALFLSSARHSDCRVGRYLM